MPIALIVLAAGQGTRMKSDLPKVLHRIAGAPLLEHALASAAPLDPARKIVVVGHGADAVAQAAGGIDPDIVIARQTEQNGTGHAVLSARTALDGFSGDVVVLYGDTPFIRPETLGAMATARTDGADLVVLGFHAADPGRYGRLITNGKTLDRIVEWKDATEAERAITLCNSGVMMADAGAMLGWLDKVGANNASGEYYLTDIVEIARDEGATARVVDCDESETQGVNSREDLARAEADFQSQARVRFLDDGVTMTAPDTVHFAHDTVIGRDAVIDQFVVFGPGVTVETGAHIRAFSHLEGAHVSEGAIVGPYARLRPGAELAENAHVGNFCEIKNATIGMGAKVNHLSYVGDASVGARTNIGAGTITCNYDGVMKHRTDIGADVFVGSNTMLVAPVTLGDGSMTASGSVITESVEDGALAVARAKQVTKPGLARRMMARLRSIKAAKKEQG